GDTGRLFTLSASGGAPADVTSSDGFQPRGLAIAKLDTTDQVFFSGTDPADGKAGVFQLAAGSNTVTQVLKGSPMVDPSGIAVSSAGVVYVADTATGATDATIYKISSGAATALLSSLKVGYPAGLA